MDEYRLPRRGLMIQDELAAAKPNAERFKLIDICELMEMTDDESYPPLLDAELDDLERLDREGTPNGWQWGVDGTDMAALGTPVCWMDENSKMSVGPSGDWGEYAKPEIDARLIATMRNALPRMLREIRRLRAAGAGQ